MSAYLWGSCIAFAAVASYAYFKYTTRPQAYHSLIREVFRGLLEETADLEKISCVQFRIGCGDVLVPINGKGLKLLLLDEGIIRYLAVLLSKYHIISISGVLQHQLGIGYAVITGYDVIGRKRVFLIHSLESRISIYME